METKILETIPIFRKMIMFFLTQRLIWNRF